jgi:hypothetical protein
MACSPAYRNASDSSTARSAFKAFVSLGISPARSGRDAGLELGRSGLGLGPCGGGLGAGDPGFELG